MYALLEKSLAFHINIYERVKQREIRKAVTNMRRHIQDIHDSLKRDYK